MPFNGREYGRSDALHKIERVIDLLASEDKWCKNRLEGDDGRRCIVGALIAVQAKYTLYRPILRAVAEVTGQRYRRIEKFNDEPHTTHECVLRILRRTRDLIQGGDIREGDPDSWAPSWKATIRRWFRRIHIRRPT